MEVWILWFWAKGIEPFEGGQYQSEERCVLRALKQVEDLKPRYGHLKWKCELWHGQA